MSDMLTPMLEATVRTATPLAMTALGEAVAQKAGVINVGLEGTIIAGCFSTVAAAGTGSVFLGAVGGMGAGLLIALLFGAFVVWLRADQIITGTAITIGSLGLTGTLYRAV
jgi:ABC-type uncharacterized transport system permease subunit